MADDFSGFHSDPMRTIRDALDKDFDSVAIGSSVDYGKMGYPAAQYVPDTSNHQGGTDYNDRHVIFYVFKDGPRSGDDEFLDHVEQVENSCDQILSDLDSADQSPGGNPTAFKPVEFEHLQGEDGNDRLHVIKVVWRLTKIFDW